MFGDLVASAGNDETRCCRYIKGVLAVATSADNVDVAVTVEDGGNACFQDAVAETQQFFDSYAAHL